jgi:II/X family phage/plasmid replication protein
LQLAYSAWKSGQDLRAIFTRPTFYRYRSQLLAYGVDIAVKQDRSGSDMSNVVPLRVVLNAYPVGVPEWASGTPLYFEPRSKVA